MGKSLNKDTLVVRRQQDSLLRWRLREEEKSKLEAANIAIQASNNVGIVYVDTSAGRVTYKLASGLWLCGYPATKTGKGVQSLQRFLKELDA